MKLIKTRIQNSTDSVNTYRSAIKKVNKLATRILGISLLVIVISSFTFVTPPNENEEVLTIENLKELLIEEGVLFPDIVLRQAIQETGWFKCDNCSLAKNNIFGFYYKKKYISYDNWQDCVRYYKRWQGRHYKGGDYYAFLKKVGFATDPSYAKKLKAIKVK